MSKADKLIVWLGIIGGLLGTIVSVASRNYAAATFQFAIFIYFSGRAANRW